MGERQRAVRPDEMATTSTAVATVSPQTQEESVERVAVITLRPASGTACAPRRRVAWAEDTVDNEHMNKKKSKCCCIYEKPRRFDESDSEDSEDECEHCFGHVEKRGHKHDTCSTVQENSAEEPPASVSLQPSAPAPPDKTGPSS